MKQSHKETLAIWQEKLDFIKEAKRIRFTDDDLIFILNTGKELKFGRTYCPLCQEYGNFCRGCPISIDGYEECRGTVYSEICDLFGLVERGRNPIRILEKAIARELEYLKGVL